MTYDLRTRIAAVLYERFATAMSFADAEWENVEQEWLEDADAVISEIDLAAALCSEYFKGYNKGRDEGFIDGWKAAQGRSI